MCSDVKVSGPAAHQPLNIRRYSLNNLSIHRGLFGRQPVACTRFGDEVPRRPRVTFELLPQPRHVHVQRVRARPFGSPPDLVEQHAIGEQLVSVGAKQSQEVVLGGRQVYELAFAQHTSALEIDLEIANPDDGFRSSLWPRDVTHGDANACEQLLQSNWLGEVI